MNNSADNSKQNILITGASGLIGSKLIRSLQDKGHSVTVLSRNPENIRGARAFHWDVENKQIDKNAFIGIDTIINLAGAGLAEKRWTSSRKQVIIDSRVESVKLLYKTISETKSPVKTFISASAIGFYGDRGDEILTENSSNGSGFLAECCKKWEEAIYEGAQLNLRIVKLRIGLVLARQGGALVEMARTVNFFLGAAFGSGKQWVPWIHLTDLLSIFECAVSSSEYKGTYNACSSLPVTNSEFTRILAKVLFRPVWPINVPEFVLKSLLGEMSTVILNSNRPSSQKLLNMGFHFRYPGLKDALKEIYSH